MKLFAVLALTVVGGFAGLGFVAGSLVAAVPAADLVQPDGDAALLDAASEVSKPETQDMAILTAAAARDAAAAKQATPFVAPAVASPGTGPHLIKMSNVTMPVRKAASVSFVVADVAVAVSDAKTAAHYEIPQNAARLQAAIEQAMAKAADTPVLRGVSIDSQQLAGTLVQDLQADFTAIEDVLFLTLYKHDVGYN